MYQAQSKSFKLAYVFDEFRLSADSIEQHPKLKFRGKVIETLEISLKTPVRDSKLIDILDDCVTDPVRKYVANKCYDNAVDYILGLLEFKEIIRNNSNIYLHVLEVNK